MLHSFKFASHRYAYDSASGSLHELDETSFKMLDYLVLPMASDCPSALRYDLAKYDSEAIAECYARMLELWRGGKLFSPDAEFEPVDAPESVPGASLVESENGLVLEPSDTPIDDLDEELKELDRRIKSAIKAGEGSFFAPVAPFEHKFEACRGCFARGLCSLAAPGEQICALERKRCEATLVLK